jgi:hypothetical protein
MDSNSNVNAAGTQPNSAAISRFFLLSILKHPFQIGPRLHGQESASQGVQGLW